MIQYNYRSTNKQILTILVSVCLPLYSFCQTIKYREYKEGEVIRYRLTTESDEGNRQGKTVAIAELKTARDSGYFSEEVSWLNKTVYLNDSFNLDEVARKVKPYRISLDPKGSVQLPKFEVAEMIGEVTDLNTFFVAISPAFNIQRLTLSNPRFIKPGTVQGNFGDGKMILKGEDCLQVNVTLLSQDKNYSIIQTEFSPPSKSCLSPILDTIGKKSFQVPNNFQMIRKAEGDFVHVLWGVESFTVTSKLENKTGKIIEATMTNTLNLKMRYNSAKDLKDYAAELPVVITRNLKLEIIK